MAYKKVYRKNFASNNEEGARPIATYANNNSNASGFGGGNEIVFDLGKKKQVTVRTFRNINLVDIREYYVDKATGENRPGKKGISLTEDTWNILLENQKNINRALDKLAGRSAPLKKSMESMAVEDIKKNGGKKRKIDSEPKPPPKPEEEEEAELVMPVVQIQQPMVSEPAAKKQKTATKKVGNKKDSDSDSDFDDDLDNLVKELESEED